MNGPLAAENSREFFSLQLRFAETLFARGAGSLVSTLTFHTNLHERFAYGSVARHEPALAFSEFVEQLVGLPDHATRLAATVAAYAVRPQLAAPVNSAEFGCFRCEHPDQGGHVRIHFLNRDASGDVGPLHRSKRARRRAELAALTAYLARAFPHTRVIDGGSWLYNVEGYRTLFPPAFVASRVLQTGPRSVHSGSIWGQLLDFRGQVKPALRDSFLARIAAPDFDVTQPWSAFESSVWITSAPFSCFRREYDC